jgi:hypothetical protein
MKKFIIKIVVFFSLFILLLCVGVFIPSKSVRDVYHTSLVNKHKYLNQTSDKQRMILIGGSNVTYGIYSPLIEENFDVKAINTAVHVGYGLKYIIDDIKPYIQENDIVVILPEYSHFYDDGLYGNLALVQALYTCPKNIKTLNVNQISTILKSTPKHSILKIRSFLSSVFYKDTKKEIEKRLVFNDNGDMISHWKMSKKKITPKKQGGKYNSKTLELITGFSDYVIKKGGMFYFSFSSLNRGSYTMSENSIDELFMKIKETEMNILGTPSRYSFTDDLHFDTVHHLTKDGQIKRTKYLIDDLKKHGLQKWLK